MKLEETHSLARRNRRGFTLVELLVVIAVIAILAGLLLAALSRAKGKAQTVQCLNNLKQLQLAWHMYSMDNGDQIPGNYPTPDIAGKFPATASWVSGFITYETIPEHAPWYSDCTNTLKLVPGGYGSIGNYTKSPGIYKCPADKSWIMIGGSRLARVRSMQMNEFMDSIYRPEGGPLCIFRKTTDIKIPPPSRAWVFIDVHEDSILGGYFAVALADPSSSWLPHHWGSLPGSRHNGAATLSFGDGHAEIKKWLDPRTRKPVERKRYIPVLEENPDAAWLQERTTSLKQP